jgi:hypothetical protein
MAELDWQLYERRRIAAENRLALLLATGGAAVGGLGLWWLIKRRNAIGASTLRGLGFMEHCRRKIAKSLGGIAESVKGEADKRG